MKLSWNTNEVNGVAIKEITRAETNLSTPDAPKYFRKAVRLVLADDTVLFGCMWEDCTYTNASGQSVVAHYKAHAPLTTRKVEQFTDWTLGDILTTLVDLERDAGEDVRAEFKEKVRELRKETYDLKMTLARRDVRIAVLLEENRELKDQVKILEDGMKALAPILNGTLGRR